MARILIYVGTRAALERYDMAGVPILHPSYPREQMERTLDLFRADPNGQLIADQRMNVGFHIPHGSFVVFDGTWKFPMDHFQSVQAMARVAIAPRGGVINYGANVGLKTR